jgi:hypothetical protein
MATLNIQTSPQKEVQIVSDLFLNIIDNKFSVPTKISLNDELGLRIKKYTPISLVPILPQLLTCADSYELLNPCKK